MCAAVATYVLVLAFVIWPACVFKRAWMAAIRTEMAERRRRNASYIAASGAWLRHVLWLFMGMCVDTHVLRDRRANIGTRPYIYVSNHRSALDGVFLPAIVARSGDLDIRWVVKQGVMKIPCISTLMSECGYAVVMRRKDAPDLSDDERRRHNAAVMDEYMRSASDESASVGIFPEGERFTGQKPGSNRSCVGDPTPGKASFRAMCERMPEHGIAIVTVVWPTLPGGKTVFDTADLCGRIVDVTVEFHPHVNPEDADRFLDDAFDTMDRAIALRMSRSLVTG
jgi:1-acyl-sn-glycerol-3-phosphate acyltransferase